MSRIIRCSHRSRGPTYKLADDAGDDDDFDNNLIIFYFGFDRAAIIGRVDQPTSLQMLLKMMMILIIF